MFEKRSKGHIGKFSDLRVAQKARGFEVSRWKRAILASTSQSGAPSQHVTDVAITAQHFAKTQTETDTLPKHTHQDTKQIYFVSFTDTSDQAK